MDIGDIIGILLCGAALALVIYVFTRDDDTDGGDTWHQW